MSTAVERYQGQPERLTREDVATIAKSAIIPAPFRNKPHDIYVAVLTGRALGIADMHALRSIYVVDGKATISAELMVTLTRRAGHSITAEQGDGFCKVTGTRADNGDTMTVTWTLEMAKRAGLLDKANWKKYPESMLWARAVSQLCRQLFPDVLAGMTYTPDEAELTPDERVEEAVGTVPVPTDDDAGPDDAALDSPREGAADAGEEPIEDAEWSDVEDSSGEGAASRAEGTAGDAPRDPAAGGPDAQAPGEGAPAPEPTPDELADMAAHADELEAAVDAELAEQEALEAQATPDETAPHTEDTDQGSIFAEMAERAIRSRKDRDAQEGAA